MISDRFEDFSQSLRVFIEQKLRFSHLFPIDAAEAVGNVEHAMKGKLDAFHSLYDAARAHPEVSFDFYANPLCCFVLHYRNAKHHNHAHGVRSAHRYARANGDSEPYLLVDYPAGQEEEGGGFIDHYVSWADFCTYLQTLPTHRRQHAEDLIRPYISAGDFEKFAHESGYSKSQIFVNVVPIIIGAGSECIGKIKSNITTDSVEAQHFLWHFQSVGMADFKNPNYQELQSDFFR